MAVRIMGEDGEYDTSAWLPNTWYNIRDDRPHIDILVMGNHAQAFDRKTKLERLDDVAPDGATWQRWSIESELARQRRFGEITLALKVPQETTLRCYVIPTALLGFGDVIGMIEDIETELGVNVTWDMADQRPDRSWSGQSESGGRVSVQELIKNVESELRFARLIRRNPFTELGPPSRSNVSLPENAIVSHWAIKRLALIKQSRSVIEAESTIISNRLARHNPDGRIPDLHSALCLMNKLVTQLDQLQRELSLIIRHEELTTSISPTPVFNRDYRLRNLLAAFSPRLSETISTEESSRSHYPPVYINSLWEMWGAVWLAIMFKKWGYVGSCSINGVNELHSCSWRLQKENIVVEIDYEIHPTFVNHSDVPLVHEREMPVLEWAAQNQSFDEARPFIGSEEKCSPDYFIRVTTPTSKYLLIGDACLASPQHHAVASPQDAKPYVIEKYRKSIGWIDNGRIIRCHPMGGFVIFPPPSEAWVYIQKLPGLGDCTILSPNPLGDDVAGKRLERLIYTMCSEFGISEGANVEKHL
ncbi:hypothetical protein ACWGK7_18515 (plasmid) [Sphingomonas aurantiaca]